MENFRIIFEKFYEKFREFKANFGKLYNNFRYLDENSVWSSVKC